MQANLYREHYNEDSSKLLVMQDSWQASRFSAWVDSNTNTASSYVNPEDTRGRYGLQVKLFRIVATRRALRNPFRKVCCRHIIGAVSGSILRLIAAPLLVDVTNAWQTNVTSNGPLLLLSNI